VACGANPIGWGVIVFVVYGGKIEDSFVAHIVEKYGPHGFKSID